MDRSLTVAEVAERLGRCKKWVYQHKRQLPFAREWAGSWFFSEVGLNAFLAGQNCAKSVQGIGSTQFQNFPNASGI